VTGSDPFLALGLEPGGGLGDDDVRAAWRRVAAATHPDRPDGGDPAAFAAAAAAYTVLRTPTGRGEALADLRAAQWSPRDEWPWPGRAWLSLRQLPGRARRGRPRLLLLRVLATAAVSAAAVAAASWQPATVAVITGMLTWLTLTGRGDLAPPS
jgi:curved DNA-binding protein CbpA